MIQIRCTTPKSAIDAFFNDALRIVKEEVTRALMYLGEQCVIRIKDRSGDDSWYDHTGNLRSSIGYAVYDYGKKLMESAFAIVRQGSKGASEGRRMVNELASEYANVYALVVVAGMDYADVVEAIESKDVLASTKSWATKEINEVIDKAKKSAEQRINSIRL